MGKDDFSAATEKVKQCEALYEHVVDLTLRNIKLSRLPKIHCPRCKTDLLRKDLATINCPYCSCPISRI